MALATTVAVLAGPSVAGAAQRYAAPGGSGEACTQAIPCTLAEAITKAKGGDEVIVGAGTYTVAASLMPESPNVHVHGEFSGPMPKVVGVGEKNVPILVPAMGGRLSYLEITHDGTNAYAASCNPGGIIERVRLVATGPEAIALTLIRECTVRDSLILAEGTKARAVHAFGYQPITAKTLVSNVTVIATGSESTGLDAEYTDLAAGSYSVELRNSIVAGDAFDLFAANSIGGPAHIEVSNSNFDVATSIAPATISGAANQTAPPVFIDSVNGDYREAPTSPTIDAGLADQIGTLDLAGNPRVLGVAPDIGAYEFVPPQPPAAAPVGTLQSLAISPKVFRPRKSGGAIVSRTRKRKAPVGAVVRYGLNIAAPAQFSVERVLPGRRVGKKCEKPTRANSKRKRCSRYRARKGRFTHAGAAGVNRFSFSGRLRGKALPPGRYRLVAKAGDSVRRAPFRVVR
ncbi:MAG TPA: choice-of-anchor Q domain-containing protein [Solirubrobacterales bacterium]